LIRIEIKGEVASILGPFKIEFLRTISKLSGRKAWYGSKSVNVEASASNIQILKQSGWEFEWIDNSGLLKEIYELERMATQHQAASVIETDYKPRVPYLPHMDHCLGISWERKAYALFLEMGLCKTSITIHNFGILFKKHRITGVIIFAPKGVHRQWIAEQIPEHLDSSIKLNMVLWDKRAKYTTNELFKPGVLNVFALNIDAVRTEAGQIAAAMFVRIHSGHVFIVVDESHDIKDYSSERTREVIQIGEHCDYRRILTGTPLGKSLADIWSQMMFLDPKIIGINYLVVFKSRFCELGGFGHKEIVGSKNIEEFYQLIAPHCYRLTKAEAIDLPPKLPGRRSYDMDTKTQKHYDNLKHSFMTELDNNELVDTASALGCVIKLQQLLSGFVTKADRTYERISTQRAQIVLDMTRQINGQCIVWSRFIEDINILKEVFESEYGDDYCGLIDIDLFKTRKKKYAFLNPASGGTGLNLQSGGCQDAIYFNNSTRAIHRWQSEDRLHRMGATGTINIWDLFCYRSVDQGIFQNIKDKKDLSDLVLDDIRKLIIGS